MWKEAIYIMVLIVSFMMNIAFCLHLYIESQSTLTVIECNDSVIEGN